jgi:hypothetical protein
MINSESVRRLRTMHARRLCLTLPRGLALDEVVIDSEAQ